MEIIYRASDGKEFFDVYSCEEHERQIKVEEYDGEITGFNRYGLPLSITNNLEEFTNKAFFVGVKTERAVKFIQEAYDGEGLALVCTKIDAYKYLWMEDEWISIDNLINKLKSDIAELKQMKEKLMGD